MEKNLRSWLDHALRPLRGRHVQRYLLCLVAVSIAAGAGHWLLPPQGLTARYHITPNWTGLPRVTIDPRIDDRRIETRVRGFAHTFSVVWEGYVTVLRNGRYRFATVSDDGSRVYIGNTLVVDNGGAHAAREVGGDIQLQAGSHPIRVEYFQDGGASTMALRWDRGSGPLAPVPPHALSPSPLSASQHELRRVLSALELLLIFLWFGTAVYAISDYPRRQLRRVVLELNATGRWHPGLIAVLVGSFVLNVVGVWWGLPSKTTWAPDEITPPSVLAGMEQYFSGGWSDLYPPLHYYLLAVVYLPFVAAERLNLLELWTISGHTLLVLAARLVSVLMATATVWVVYLCGTILFRARHALFAAAIVALVPPFVYYAKTANVDVPYLFWFSLTLLFYIRLMKAQRVQDYLAFAVFATLAVCTKDQAYAFYVLLVPVIAIARYRYLKRQHLIAGPGTLAKDRALWGSLMAAVLLCAVCHNLPANASGFAEHVRLITGPGSEGFRTFENTPSGHAQLFLTTLRQLRQALGWPMFIVCAAGVVTVLKSRDGRRLWWVLVPAVSYYVFFIGVVLYTYDRFLLGVCVVLALFGGKFLGDFTRRSSQGWWLRVAIVSVLFAVTFAYAGLVDTLMAVDSRYHVEEWIEGHVTRDSTIATVGFGEYLPRMHDYKTSRLSASLEGLANDRPDYVLVNAEFGRRFSAGTPQHAVLVSLRNGQAGYRLVLNHQCCTKWIAVARTLGFHDLPEEGSTNLDKINPRIEIFERSTQ